MKAAETAREAQGAKLEKAADAIKGKSQETKVDEVLGAVTETAAEVSEQIRDTIEDAVDTVKAIAEVVGGKINEKVQETKEKIQETIEEVTEEAPKAEVEEIEEEEISTPEEAVNVVAPKPEKAGLPEDLKIVEGIGPKIEEILQGVGIKTWDQLAKTSSTQLSSILLAAGSRYKSHNPSTWPKQARMAADGQWDELKAWQDELDGGVDRKAQRRAEEEE